jgi:hypothetical protein
MTLTPDVLVGAWTLVEWRIEMPDGRRTHPFGPDAEGLIVYTASGLMSATLSRRTRTPLSMSSPRQADPASLARAFNEYLAYTARWSLDGDTVVHTVLLSMNPVLIGTRQLRHASFEGTDLWLAAHETSGASARTHRIRWRRT